MKLIEKVKYTGILTCETGIHIGDSKETADIGGVDIPVVRRVDNNVPYIPGSSIKGKIRCLLEQSEGASKVGGSAKVNKLFGITGDNQRPSRLIVRDAFMDEKSEQTLKENTNTDLPYTEIKFENSIDRVKGSAEHPRQIERVPAGTKFNLEFIINVFEGDDELSKKEQLNLLRDGLDLLENDYLGGNGSRGYGHVSLKMYKPKTVFPNQ